MAKSRFVVDGHSRALAGLREEAADMERRIRQAVEQEYAPKLAKAGPLRRMYLRMRIRQEIDRRLDEWLRQRAPHDALYLRR
jgi:hypothetical protein